MCCLLQSPSSETMAMRKRQVRTTHLLTCWLACLSACRPSPPNALRFPQGLCRILGACFYSDVQHPDTCCRVSSLAGSSYRCPHMLSHSLHCAVYVLASSLACLHVAADPEHFRNFASMLANPTHYVRAVHFRSWLQCCWKAPSTLKRCTTVGRVCAGCATCTKQPTVEVCLAALCMAAAVAAAPAMAALLLQPAAAAEQATGTAVQVDRCRASRHMQTQAAHALHGCVRQGSMKRLKSGSMLSHGLTSMGHSNHRSTKSHVRKRALNHHGQCVCSSRSTTACVVQGCNDCFRAWMML